MANPQTIFGQSDAVALTLVDALNQASTAGAFCLTLTAQRVFGRLMDIGALPKIGNPVDVQVFPGHDQGDRAGLNGIYDEVYGVHILLQQVVIGAREAQCALLMQLRSQIVNFLCSKQMDSDNTAVNNFTNSRVFAHRHGPEGIYDLKRLEELNVFYSDLILTYKASVVRRP